MDENKISEGHVIQSYSLIQISKHIKIKIFGNFLQNIRGFSDYCIFFERVSKLMIYNTLHYPLLYNRLIDIPQKYNES